MLKLSQETIAIVTVGIALTGLEYHGRTEAQAAREAIRDEAHAAHFATLEAISAGNQAVIDAVKETSITGQAEGTVAEIIEKVREIAEHIEDAAP